MDIEGIDKSDEEEAEDHEEIEEEDTFRTLEEETVSKKIAAIEAHKRSRSTFFICVMGIAATVITTIFVSISVWAGAAAACIFSGVFAMLAVKAIKDFKYLESAYGLGKKRTK